MHSKEYFLHRIPRTSGGTPLGEDGKYVDHLISRYRFSEKEMGFLEQAVECLIKKYGREGRYILKKNRAKPIYMAQSQPA